MIIVPEKETVLILPPKTASKSLQVAVMKKFPKAFMPYRHMEADGVPFGYDRWKKVGFVRHPLERMWSLYKFLERFEEAEDEEYIQIMRDSVKMDFSDWLVNNRIVFTSQHSKAGGPEYHPFFAVLHALPENMKSQFLYLRPDLGTQVWNMSQLQDFARHWGLDMTERRHVTVGRGAVPKVSREAWYHMRRCHKWDFEVTECG